MAERGNRYQAIQGTKPQTIGIALNDSPVGLAAWIVEKFQSWCDCDGNPETIFAKDDLLANISLYWFTQTAASSARIYFEQRHPLAPADRRRIEAPTACADFPREVFGCHANGSRRDSTSRGGRRCRAADISPRLSSRSFSSRKCARSFGTCDRHRKSKVNLTGR